MAALGFYFGGGDVVDLGGEDGIVLWLWLGLEGEEPEVVGYVVVGHGFATE